MSSSSEAEKRCLYVVLGVSRDCTTEEIRSAYKKLALQRHPDKLIKSGLSEAEATAQFQELVNAYDVLSDQRERAWYDSHRSQILFSSSKPGNSSSTSVYVPDLFAYFYNSIYSGYSDSGKGFYKVYGEAFDKIYQNELNFAKKMGVGFPSVAPLMGNLECPYAQVTAFYNYWIGFVTVMDFCWVDEYNVMSGPNRKTRRVMEEENKKLRKKARREYNETVRGLAEFAKRRDKRVIDMQLKRNEELERKKEEERKRKEELARLRAEQVRKYEEQIDDVEDELIEEAMEENGKEGNLELYCVACGKKFKSEKQWKNHEQSKKHKEKVAELRETFIDEDREYEEVDIDERDPEEAHQEHAKGAEVADGVFPTGADELSEQIEKQMALGEDDTDAQSADTYGSVNSDAESAPREQDLGAGAEDDELSILESMVSWQKNRNKAGTKQKCKLAAKEVQLEVDTGEVDDMVYNNMKGSRRNKGGRRQRGRTPEEAKQNGSDENNVREEEITEPDDSSDVHEPASYSLLENLIGSKLKAKVVQLEVDSDEINHMGYNNIKPTRRNKGGRRRKDRTPEEAKQSFDKKNGQAEENIGHHGSSGVHDPASYSLSENPVGSRGDDKSERVHKLPNEAVGKKNAAKQDGKFKVKEAGKGKKDKASAKASSKVCDKCGEEYESRNKKQHRSCYVEM